MSAKIIDGKQIAADLIADIHARVESRVNEGKRRPGLAVVLVGEDPASHVYVRNKENACTKAGFVSKAIRKDTNITQDELNAIVDKLNNDDEIDGILVQMPLPKHLDGDQVINRIVPEKDVDGFHPQNVGRLALKLPGLRSCTPHGVMTMLEKTGVELAGLDAVVIGQSNIVGRPMALELLMARCTVTICHSRTKNLQEKVGNADLVVAAVGRPKFVPGEWIKEGAIVIDVGINRTDEGKLVGDVDYEPAARRASWITPVPGGVGPMTIATLMENTLQACEMRGA